MTEMKRYNTGKPQLSYLPSSFWDVLMTVRGEDFNDEMVTGICKVLEFGAAKYSKDNWRTGGSWCRVADSGLRHLVKYIQGETHDQESGLPHLAHFGCNLVFLIEFNAAGSGLDDRYKRPGTQMLRSFEEDEASEIMMLQLVSRWLECEGDADSYLWDALALLSDLYGEEDETPDTTTLH